MDRLKQDLRYAVRQMARRPGFTAVLVVTLALGIGANTAVFSVVEGVLLRPLPYPEPDELTVVWTRFPTMELMEFPASWPEYVDYRDASRSWEALGLWGRTERTFTGGEAPERVTVAWLTARMFDVLGVAPALGRAFTPDEDVDGRDRVVVLGHGLWQRRFGGDPAVVGRSVEMDGEERVVLGVMPAGFAFPDDEVQAWIPLGIDPGDPPGRASHFANILGRLAPGVSLEEATTELATLTQRWQDDPELGHNWHREFHPAYLRPLQTQTVGDVRAALLVLMGAVGLVLLIACANVANLLLVRGEGRLRELSIRTALGAGRGRIATQLVTESLLMALLGGAAGVALAWAGLQALLALAPPELPRTGTLGLNGWVLAFSGALTLVAGLLFGMAPALQTLRADVQGALREEGRGGSVGKTRSRLRQLLVVGQTSLAVVLLVGAGLLLRSFQELRAVDPGFRSDGVLMASVTLTDAGYPEPAQVFAFYDALTRRLEALPGVASVGLVRTPPLTGSLPPNDIEIEGVPRTETDGPPLNADIQLVSAGYFETVGIPLLLGRTFDDTDDTGSEAVAVVDEELARRFFPDPARAVGDRIRQPGREWARIVGVVGGVHQEGLDVEPRAHLYLLHAQGDRSWFAARGMTALLRTPGDPLALVPAVRAQVQELDPELPVHRVATLAGTVAESTARQRFTLFLQLVFAGVALALAVVGIYGVLAYSVAQRTREVGIRMALGAERGAIVGMVVRQGMGLVALAILLGIGGALAAGGVLDTLLYGVTPRDPWTYATVVVVLGASALAASWLPARRASSVSPQEALRHE